MYPWLVKTLTFTKFLHNPEKNISLGKFSVIITNRISKIGSRIFSTPCCSSLTSKGAWVTKSRGRGVAPFSIWRILRARKKSGSSKNLKNIVFLKKLEILWREYHGQRRWWEEDHRGFQMDRILKPISKCCRTLMTIVLFLMIQVWKRSEYLLYDENFIIPKFIKFFSSCMMLII